jgi:hypothetical protein
MSVEAGVNVAALATVGIVGYYIYTLTDKDPQKKPTPPPRSRGDGETAKTTSTSAADALRIKEEHAAMWEEQQHQQRLQRQKEEHAAWQKRQQAEAAAAKLKAEQEAYSKFMAEEAAKRKAAADAAKRKAAEDAAAAAAAAAAAGGPVTGVAFSIDLKEHFTPSQIEQIKNDLHNIEGWYLSYNLGGWTPIGFSKNDSIWNISNGVLHIGTFVISELADKYDGNNYAYKTGMNIYNGHPGAIFIGKQLYDADSRLSWDIVGDPSIFLRFNTDKGTWNGESYDMSYSIFTTSSSPNGIYSHAFTPITATWIQNGTKIVGGP